MTRGGFRTQFVLWSIMAVLQLVRLVGSLVVRTAWDLGDYLSLAMLILAAGYLVYLLHVRRHDGRFWEEEEARRGRMGPPGKGAVANLIGARSGMGQRTDPDGPASISRLHHVRVNLSVPPAQETWIMRVNMPPCRWRGPTTCPLLPRLSSCAPASWLRVMPSMMRAEVLRLQQSHKDHDGVRAAMHDDNIPPPPCGSTVSARIVIRGRDRDTPSCHKDRDAGSHNCDKPRWTNLHGRNDTSGEPAYCLPRVGTLTLKRRPITLRWASRSEQLPPMGLSLGKPRDMRSARPTHGPLGPSVSRSPAGQLATFMPYLRENRYAGTL